MMETNYFVCTLGQASQLQHTKARSIPKLLSLLSKEHGRSSAVGFAHPENGETMVLSFEDLDKVTNEAARRLQVQIPQLRHARHESRVVALLCHSNIAFLQAWLGLIKLGFSVLLLAPQLDGASVEALCSQSNVTCLFHDAHHQDSAKRVQGLETIQIEPYRVSEKRNGAELEESFQCFVDLPDVPYLHHSSGTSSGTPKTISQRNAGAFMALPDLSSQQSGASFSSTPLYHGGVADCFRAWTSGQMIWLFPGGNAPITGQTVAACIRAADKAASLDIRLKIRYFSSVPYVLRDLAATSGGLETLRAMEIVGVGGAAFPHELGDKLVKQGIRLVSRYGSAECGFILSSYRLFESDSGWDHLRSDEGSELLSFEVQENGLYELVVRKGWPHMARPNRPDGSFATADLFEKHPTIPNAWRYHSRADAQIVLVSGKKFDPEPIESAVLTRASQLISDILVVGKDETYPGALVFVQKRQVDQNPDFREQLWAILDEINADSPTHARVSKNMFNIIEVDEATSPLEKSSKGTVLRGKANDRYQDEIKNLYLDSNESTFPSSPISDRSELVEAVTRIIVDTTGKALAETDDFYDMGIDSIACMQARQRIDTLRKQLKQSEDEKLNGYEKENCLETLPANLLYDCGTIGGVADHLITGTAWQREDEVALMPEFAAKYSRFDFKEQDFSTNHGQRQTKLVVLLTGATGALGTHILNVLRSRSDVCRIYCLLRATDKSAARARVDTALKLKALRGLCSSSIEEEKIVCLPCNLAQAGLGIGDESITEIKNSVNLIVHAAWAVNFTLKLKTFDPHLAGVVNLLNLGAHAACSEQSAQGCRRVNFLFCSSIASVADSSSTSVQETISHNPHDSSPLGYSRSKWVAEKICQEAQRAAARAKVPLKVDIIRIGQLCGDQTHGIWNVSEAWPLMLSSYGVCSALPEISGEKLNWLPVDIAAMAIIELGEQQKEGGVSRDQAQVFHVLNPYSTPTWGEMLGWLRVDEGDRLKVLSPAMWIETLEKHIKLQHPSHPSGKLLDLWKGTYLSHNETAKMQPEFEVMGAMKGSEALRNLKPLSPQLVRKMWKWIQQSIVVN